MKKSILICLCLAGATIFSTAASAQMIIANNSVKATEASKSDLKDVFTGESTSLGGSHVSPVLLKSGATNDAFLAEYIGKADIAFRAIWRSLVFSGKVTMPKTFDSDAAVVEYTAHNPGTIGYIGKSSPHEGVKVIVIH